MNRKHRIRIHVHPAGAVMIVVALLFLPSVQVIAALSALLWHECAHLAAFLCCGVKNCTIELTPFGGMADVKAFEKLKPIRQMICALTGIAGSAAGIWLTDCLCTNASWHAHLLHDHLSLAVVNCLPAWPLDGARALTALAAAFGKEQGMRRVLSALSAALGTTMVLAALWGTWHGWFNPSLLLAGPYLWYASRQGLTAEKIRQIDHNRMKLALHESLPAEVNVSSRKDIEKHFPVWIGRWTNQRYHLLVQLDQNGKLLRFWTEDEMMRSALEEE